MIFNGNHADLYIWTNLQVMQPLFTLFPRVMFHLWATALSAIGPVDVNRLFGKLSV